MAKYRKGRAECAICMHTWEAHVEDGGFDPSLECPNCGSMSGMFAPVTVEESDKPRCIYCGRIVKREGVCVHCNSTGRFD